MAVQQWTRNGSQFYYVSRFFFLAYCACDFRHRTLANKPISEWREEMDGMRKALEKFSYVDANKVIGVRAPQHATGGTYSLNA